MEVLVLGLGGMMPMPDRHLTSAALRLAGRSTLFDCGEGTQIPLKRSGWGVGHCDRLVLTHIHADHVTGVPGFLMLLAQAGPRPPVHIVALPEVCTYVETTYRLLGFHLPFPLRYVRLDSRGGSVATGGFTLHYRPLRHPVPVLGFRVEEPPRPGRFDAARAEELGIPPGPLRAALQAGRSVRVGDRTIPSRAVVGPPRRGRRFAYIVDTGPCDAVGELLEGCDLALLEGMFLEEHAPEAAAKQHLTVRRAARFAREARARRVLLVHVSPRYRREELARLEAEAREEYDRVELARPLARYPVPLPDGAQGRPSP